MGVIAYEYRSELVDLIHRGHIAVADHTGALLWSLGNPRRTVFARSSAKPIQAIPVVESGAAAHFGITQEELAVICASHNGEPFHIDAVSRVLRKARLSAGCLLCGAEYPMYVPAEDALKCAGVSRAPIYCDCSGKHAGMLITAKHLGEPLDSYDRPDHPHQKRLLGIIADICGVSPGVIRTATDGCGVPVHALPLYRFAQGYARMSLPGLFPPQRAAAIRQITDAMTSYPQMVAGSERVCTYLMSHFGEHLFCKSGANAFYAIGLKDRGIGIAVKMEDGASALIPPVVLALLTGLGIIPPENSPDIPEEWDLIVRNSHHAHVGRIELVPALNRKISLKRGAPHSSG